MNYIKNLQSIKKQQNSKNINNLFKYTLLFITLFVVFLIILTFITLIIRGISSVNDSEINKTNLSWFQILFGNEFSMSGEMAMGIIIINTIWMALLVLLVATPISVSIALFISKILNKSFKLFMISIVLVLAAIPSVVYGSFGKYFLMKFLFNINLSQSSTDPSLLIVIILLSIMVVPTITLMSLTSINIVDKKLEDSSEALGATKIQTSIYVTLKSAKTGIIIGMLFALGRCLGEATAISMLSGSTIKTTGITLNIFHTSLFMSPVIMSAFSQSANASSPAFIYTLLSALLLLTIIIIFLIAKYIENKTDDKLKSKKQSKIIYLIKKIIKKTKNGEILTKREQSLYKSYLIKKSIVKEQNSNQLLIRNVEYSKIISRSTLSSSLKFSSYKNIKTNFYKFIIIFLSLFGILFLISILGFLFNTNLSLLFNWNYLTNRSIVEGTELRGLGMSMFGTIINIIIVLLVALPLGIAIATYSNVFMNKDSFIAKIISFSFQIMISIPAVVYGTIATILFVEGGFIRNNLNSLIPMLMLVFVILPTIIKQTQEGINNVESPQLEGSLALGASKTYSSRRIIIKQSLPAILSAAILGISIVMADSAIMITILKHPVYQSTTSGWIQEGGYTLSSQIYWISQDINSNVISSRSSGVEQIKVIGIILMFLIFWLTIISQKIKNRENWGSLIMFIGILLFTLSFYIMGGIFIFTIIGLFCGFVGIFIDKFKLIRK